MLCKSTSDPVLNKSVKLTDHRTEWVIFEAKNMKVFFLRNRVFHLSSPDFNVIFFSPIQIRLSVNTLRGVEWVHGLFLFPHVLGKMKLPHAKLDLFCVA